MKLIFNILICCSVFTFTANAQHGANKKAKDLNQIPPQVILSKMINNDKINNQEIKLVIVTFAPGEVAAAHRHPMPSALYLMEGDMEMTFEGKVTRLKKGDTFWEDAHGLHTEAKNLNADKPAKLLVFFIGDKDDAISVPEK